MMKDKEKTQRILKILPIVYPFDHYICVPEFRFGSGYGNTSEKRADLFCISPEKGNKTITAEIKVSRSDFLRDKNDCRKQVAARLFSNEVWYVFPKGLLKKEEIPLWAGALEIDLERQEFNGYYELLNIMCPAPLLEREQPTWGLIVSALRRKALNGESEEK